MKKENLCCLVVFGDFVALNRKKLDQISENNKPEIDLEKGLWKDEKWGWLKIGEDSGTGQIRFIYDHTNFEHSGRALRVVADFSK